jgi:hypothetical protein
VQLELELELELEVVSMTDTERGVPNAVPNLAVCGVVPGTASTVK